MFADDVHVAPAPGKTYATARDSVQARIDEVRAQLGPAVADVTPEPVAAIGSPVEVLLEAARNVDLLVVGHRGRGAWRSALLGSVGLGVVLHAACPVTVVQAAPERSTSASPRPGRPRCRSPSARLLEGHRHHGPGRRTVGLGPSGPTPARRTRRGSTRRYRTRGATP
jgi:hypothetical protein